MIHQFISDMYIIMYNITENEILRIEAENDRIEEEVGRMIDRLLEELEAQKPEE
jgi:hypothetical protein